MFEDNQSTIAVAKALSMLPHTKHIALKYHHFQLKFLLVESQLSTVLLVNKSPIYIPSHCQRLHLFTYEKIHGLVI